MMLFSDTLVAMFLWPGRALDRAKSLNKQLLAARICLHCKEAPTDPGCDTCYDCQTDLKW